MLQSKATVFGMVAALILMTGAFTALSSNGTDGAATASDIDEFILVNGEEVPEADFVTRVATVEQNLVILTAQAESEQADSALAESMLEIMENTPAETIALASLILDKALYQEAVARGHMPDEQMIAEQIEQERTMFEMIEADPEQFGVDESAVENYRDNIESIGGEDVYWNEHYPQVIEQQMTMQQFQMAIGQEGEDWIEVQRQAFADADVQIGDPEEVAPATVSDAGEYLNAVWGIYQTEDAG